MEDFQFTYTYGELDFGFAEALNDYNVDTVNLPPLFADTPPALPRNPPPRRVPPPLPRSRPPPAPVSDADVLRNNLINFKRNANIESFLTVNLRGNLSRADAFNIIFNILQPIGDERFAIMNGEAIFPVTNTTKERIRNIIQGNVSFGESEGSDKDLVSYINYAPEISFVRLPNHQKTKRAGAFFPYINKTELDLTRQGISNKPDALLMSEACLITSLRNGGLPEDSITNVKLLLGCNKIPMCKLKDICENVDICIKLKHMRLNKTKNDKTTTIIYGDEKKQTFNIGLVSEHFFLIEKVPITSYALKNFYNDTSKFDIADNSGKRKSNRFIDSYKAIEILLENKNTHLEPVTVDDDIMNTPYYDKVNEYSTLSYNKSNVKEIKKETKEKKNIYEQIIYLDFETDTSDGLHKPYLAHYVNDASLETRRAFGDAEDEKKINEFVGSYCALNLLQTLTKNTVIYAHNAGYDFRFLTSHLFAINPILKGSGMISATAMFYNKKIDKTIKLYIKDSYKLISSPLSEFGKMFNLDQKKELLPYSLYTTDNINKRFISLTDILKCHELETKEKKEQYIKNCNDWKLLNNGFIDIIQYSSNYCYLDCLVLCKGVKKFREWMLEATEIDIHNIVSIPSLVHKYFVNQGVYDDVKQLSGIPRHFIQKCVVGGRVMVSQNKKVIVDNQIINDFDAVSLYPSAMKRLGEQGGFLKGIPKVLKNFSYSFLEKQDGYFIKIIIRSVGKKYDFPLMSYVDDNGIRQFTNDMVGKYMFVDKFMLEDLIQFHKITFDIDCGYYFNEGRNTKILEVIKHLFNERIKKKKEKNPIQVVYKLLMNSAYGKTLLKPIATDKIIINGKENLLKYISANFDFVKECIPLAYNKEMWVVKKIKPIVYHFNICQVGVEILSMSKRLMNEVMCLAEDTKLKIYYQDTDSMHLNDVDKKILEKVYNAKYNRELIGKGMGQFHSDFEIKGCKDVVSKKLIALGKKCYIDLLEGIDEKTGEKKTGYHIRLKGIPSSTVDYEVNKKYNGDPMKLYEDLYNGKKVAFDLLEGGRRCRFNSRNDLGIESMETMIREVGFQ